MEERERNGYGRETSTDMEERKHTIARDDEIRVSKIRVLGYFDIFMYMKIFNILFLLFATHFLDYNINFNRPIKYFIFLFPLKMMDTYIFTKLTT